MSIRGVAQLRARRLVYCDVTGTSRGIKEFVLSGGWDEFKARALVHGDSTEATTEIRRGGDPHVRATYANGHEKAVGLKNLSANAVETHVRWLASEKGKPGSKPMKHRHFTKKPSVQGRWTPFTFGGGRAYVDEEED
jgi:large subunit ribosomal protein L43